MHDDPNSLSNPQLKDKHELGSKRWERNYESLVRVLLPHEVFWVPHEVKVKVKFTLEQITKVQRGSRDIALLFL